MSSRRPRHVRLIRYTCHRSSEFLSADGESLKEETAAARLGSDPVIDLHTHTTASDGLCTPEELVARAAGAGVSVLSVTDHDTISGCAAAAAACASAGIEFVAGIEITAVRAATDVHVLGYFISRRSPVFLDFLAAQRRQRIDRVRLMIDRLADFGVRLDADAILQPGVADVEKAAGRPWLARALVSGGHVKTTNEAFDRWLSRGRPAFVPRVGATPEAVFAHIHEAGGVASLAHPGLLAHDEWIPGFVTGGLDAIEVYHSGHDRDATMRYRELAAKHSLGVSGGSDYHADGHHGASGLGGVSLPRSDFDRLVRLPVPRPGEGKPGPKK